MSKEHVNAAAYERTCLLLIAQIHVAQFQPEAMTSCSVFVFARRGVMLNI